MFKQIIIASATGLIALSAFANGQPAGTYELKDGSTLHVFTDGKMGMEDKVGRVLSMNEGHTMVTTDGKQIVMAGNELAHTANLLRHGAD